MAPHSDERRRQFLHRLEGPLEMPMVALGFVWLVLLIIELIRGLSRPLELAGTAIWLLFVLEFAVRLAIAPRRVSFLRTNWLTVIALAVPALRVFRLTRAFGELRALRITRGLRLVRIVTSLNRGMRSLGRSLARNGFAYVAGVTALVTLAGSAGMYAFERAGSDGNLRNYGEALWWTAMLITTLGSDYWPETTEGRMLCLFLAVYALGVFGYVAATLASFFIGRDARAGDTNVAGESSLASLRNEIAALRADVRAMTDASGPRSRGSPL